MPGMGGVELLEALREAGHDIRMVLMSGHPLGEEMEGLQASNPLLVGWMAKPPDLAHLADVVAGALAA